jgi:uncharacterized protein (DUF1778 family)
MIIAMDATADKESKAERIELRVTPRVKALLNAAAQARHTTVSDFLLGLGIEAAEQVITSPRVFYVSEDGWAAVDELLNEETGRVPDDETISWLRNNRRET